MSEVAVDVREPRERGGNVTAVAGLELRGRRDEEFGLLGPVGAGYGQHGGDP
ncbi:hypothetical protein ABZ079_12005 [Streptomyces sp. NPDC006314]|uniref:hypothetical protein n=1 Tax=Streptomyces sp. NPDC006314 TaxID=3154475 RepID=UPI0033BA9509